MRIKRNKALFYFLSACMLLILIGFIFIYSSSSVFALEKLGSAHYFIKKQAVGLLLGLVGLILLRIIPLSILERWAPWLFWLALGLTALTLVPRFGITIHGSHRWLKLGPLAFQPSEILKLSCIMYLAYLLAKKRNAMNSLVHCYLPLLFITGLSALIMLKQPDFGQAVTLGTTAFLLFFVAQIPARHLITTLLPIIPALGLLIYFAPYRMKRLTTFLHPWHDPLGAGFQIIQSLIAIGSGGLWGVGIGQSKQKYFYLPMQHTDFIFSIIAEETGFIGMCVLIGLYLIILYTGLRLALAMNNLFASYTTMGFTLLISIQALVNMFVATGLMPTKGIGLPLVSYGNSALITTLAMLGFIINGATERRS